MVHVTAPGSSANLGPGFDSLGLALDLPFELIGGQTASGTESNAAVSIVPDGFLEAEPTHPARVAYVAAGGHPDEVLWWRSPIPPGWGIGFSGAARVAGAYLAVVSEPVGRKDPVRAAFQVAARLERHPDNAAASAFGGMTVAVAEEALRVRMPSELEQSLRVVTWSPAKGTSTDSSRARIANEMTVPAAIGSIGRSALWVAAIAAGRLDVLREACRDELHQPARLAARPDSAAVLEGLLNTDEVLAAWLSGSGPTVAALVADPTVARTVAASLSSRTHPVHTSDVASEVGDSEVESSESPESTAKTRRRDPRVRILGLDLLGVRQVNLDQNGQDLGVPSG